MFRINNYYLYHDNRNFNKKETDIQYIQNIKSSRNLQVGGVKYYVLLSKYE